MAGEQLGSFWDQQTVDLLTMALPLALVLFGMLFAVLTDSYIRRKRKAILICIMALSSLLLAENCLSGLWQDRRPIPLATACSALGYSLRPVILVLFLGLVDTSRPRRWEWLLAGANAALYLTAFFSPLTFYYTPEGRWVAGPLRDACLAVSACLLAELVWLTVRRYRGLRRGELLIPLFNALVIVAATLLDYSVGDTRQVVSFLTIAIIISSLFFYVWLHLQFVREHERALEAEQRIQIMMTQIQPHFLYNTLSTIQALCHIDPEKAYEITGKFGTYLRQNLTALESGDLIPLQTELEHTRVYADIETVRFPHIRVEYDIRDDGFSLPALTVQPMVENAIRHGVRAVRDGTVRITAVRTAAGHQIVVADNGRGFDPGESGPSGGHIGIRNVRERVERLCGGSLTIRSRKGQGTEVTIDIPLGAADRETRGD